MDERLALPEYLKELRALRETIDAATSRAQAVEEEKSVELSDSLGLDADLGGLVSTRAGPGAGGAGCQRCGDPGGHQGYYARRLTLLDWPALPRSAGARSWAGVSLSGAPALFPL